MVRFEQQEAADMAEHKALLEKPADDDGFVTVTYKKKRGRGRAPTEDTPEISGRSQKRKRGSSELPDFYRFQVGAKADVRAF